MSAPLIDRWPVRLAVGLVAPALLALWWQWQASLGGAHAAAFASLASLGGALGELIAQGTLLADTAATLLRALAGLALGASLGLGLGVALGVLPLLDRLLSPLLNALRQVPMVGWLPLVGLWLGTGDAAALVVIGLSAFFPAMLNAHAGIAQVEPRYLEVARVLGFSPVQRLRLVLLPAALPLLLTGLTQAAAFTWIAAIGTEILQGTGGGLGVTMQLAETQQRLDIILVAIALTAFLGFALNQAVVLLRRHLLRWQAAPF
ncbi:MAG TPA: ABC transporter permease subunit [Novosphingobium sp.]|nr:ABC transporter permease subunit [Novosphingobium sp.]